MKVIGFDFSIKKPACCIYDGTTYKFISWPAGISEKIKDIYREGGVNIVDRIEDKPSSKLDVSGKMRHDVLGSRYLSNLIVETLKDEIDDPETYVCWEGLSFASSGNVALQLGGYKYMVMDKLDRGGLVSMDKQITYAPLTIKKTAGCSTQIVDPTTGKKRAQGKAEMIQAFIDTGMDIGFRNYVQSNRELYRKKGDKNWIDHLDDLVDGFWLVRTFLEKEIS